MIHTVSGDALFTHTHTLTHSLTHTRTCARTHIHAHACTHGRDGRLRMIHVASGEVVFTVEHPGKLFCVGFSPLGDKIATGAYPLPPQAQSTRSTRSTLHCVWCLGAHAPAYPHGRASVRESRRAHATAALELR